MAHTTKFQQLEGPRISSSQVDEAMPGIATIMERHLSINSLDMEEEEAVSVGHKGQEEEQGEDDDNDTECSFEFSSSMSLDLHPDHNMLSAEELFFNGQLRPLQSRDSGSMPIEQVQPHEFRPLGKVHLPIPGVDKSDAVRRNSDVEKHTFYGTEMVRGRGESFEFRGNLPMVRTSLHESLAMAKQHLRSLQESPRCLSMTIEGSRNYPRRSCVSLNSSRCSSPTRLRTSGAFSQPPTTPTSPKSSSSQKNSKFFNFFKLKKHLNASKEALQLLSSDNRMVSQVGSRMSRTFWPFSRSNSAGESKSSHGVSPAPRRSNSAGESKTTSSSLLPNKAIINKRNSEASRSDNTAAAPSMVFSRKLQTSQSLTLQAYKQGLPPLIPTSSHAKKNSSSFVLSNCGNDAVALSQMADSHRSPIVPTSYTSPSIAHTCTEVAGVVRAQADEADHLNSLDFSCISKEPKARSASPGRHVWHASVSKPARNMSRGSPSRQWSNPSMGSSTRSRQRLGPPVRSLINSRQKDALTRDAASVRVTPVLNVPACMTPSSKSKLFNLGNIFSKREKVVRGYTMLVGTDSQSGG